METSNSKKMLTVISVFLGLFVISAQGASASTLYATAAKDIGGLEIYTLTSTLNGAVSSVFMALFGFLAAKRASNKTRIMTISMFLAAAALLIRAIAPNMFVFILSALPYSVISGAVFTCGYSAIRDLYPAEKAGTLLGFGMTLSSIGGLAGPALFGMIAQVASWRLCFHIMWVICLASGICSIMGAKIEDTDIRDMKFNVGGTVALVVFSIPLILFISLGGSRVPFGTIGSWLILAVAIIGLVFLVMDSKKSGARAIIPAVAVKDRNTILITATLALFSFAGMAVAYFMATYVLYVIGGTSGQAGLASSLMQVIGLVLSPILGRYIAKSLNAKGVLLSAALVRAAILLILIFFLNPTTNIVFIYVIMFLYGYSSCVENVGGSVIPQMVIAPELRVQGNAFLQFAKLCIQNTGTAVFGAMIAAKGVNGGIKPSYWIAFAACILAAICALSLKVNKPQKESA